MNTSPGDIVIAKRILHRDDPAQASKGEYVSALAMMNRRVITALTELYFHDPENSLFGALSQDERDFIIAEVMRRTA